MPPAATLEAPAAAPENVIQQPLRGTAFLARRADLRLVFKPEHFTRDGSGNVTGSAAGHHSFAFTAGRLVIPETEEMRDEDGNTIATADVIEWLNGHRLNGDKEEGFWRLEQPAPPLSEAETTMMAELAQELDVEGLEAFVAREEAGWARETLLGPARGALERARGKLADREQELAKARAAGEAAARESTKGQAQTK